MMSVIIEQRIVLKFLMKLGKPPKETYELLKEVYGSKCLSRSRIYEWFKLFQDGRENVEDDARPVRPSTSKPDDNIEEIGNLVRSNRRLSISAIAETLGIDEESVRQILHDNFNMQKVCGKMVPKMLTLEQHDARKNVCTDTLTAIENDPSLLGRIITCDESWFSAHDPETKNPPMHRRSITLTRAKLAGISKLRFKAVLIAFFDSHGIVHHHWIPDGEIVDQHYYLRVLAELRERIRKKRPGLWKDKSWVLHQDNAPAHSALAVKRFLAKHSIPVLEYPPYSPDLAPCDFYLFPKVKSRLIGTNFESVEALKAKVEHIMNALTKEDFQNCFEQWKMRMELCRDKGGVYIEDDQQTVPAMETCSDPNSCPSENTTTGPLESVGNRRKNRGPSIIKSCKQRKKSPAPAPSAAHTLNEDELLLSEQENKTKAVTKRKVQKKRQKKDLSAPARCQNPEFKNINKRKLIADQTSAPPSSKDVLFEATRLQLENSNGLATASDEDENDKQSATIKNKRDNDFMLKTEQNTTKSDGCNTTITNPVQRKKRKNSEDFSIICKICKKPILNALELEEHNESVHGRLLQCSMCNFNGKEYLVVKHMIEVHAGLDTVVYKCEKCEQTFSTNDECQQHQQQHALKDAIKNHLTAHLPIIEPSGEDAKQCNICVKMQKSTQELAECAFLETGMRPYQCLYCHLSYSSRAKYNAHLRNMHEMMLNSREFDQLCLQTLLKESSLIYHSYLASMTVSDVHEILSYESDRKEHNDDDDDDEEEEEMDSVESDMFVAVQPEIEIEIGENEIHF